MSSFRRIIFWLHLTLGIGTGLVGALMAGTGAIMAFADSYLDVREYSARRVSPPEGARPKSLESLLDIVNAKHPQASVTRIGLDRDPHHAYEFYHDPQALDYVNPYTGELRSTDSVPLRRALHKGVEQWHRFFGLKGKRGEIGKLFTSWVNAALIPLFLTGLVLWWPNRLRWRVIRAALIPTGGGRGRGTQRSWHTALGFWALPLMLIMVVTATTHSFEWVRTVVHQIATSPSPPGSHDSLWAPGLAKRSLPEDVEPLTPDELRVIADRELPGWTRLDIFPAAATNADSQTGTARLLAKAPGWGPLFFSVVLQVDPYTGEMLDTHSWDDLSGSTRVLAWSRWLHKGEAFGRTGQIVAGVACLVMLVLIYTGWSLAIRRLLRNRRVTTDQG